MMGFKQKRKRVRQQLKRTDKSINPSKQKFSKRKST